jgi:Fe-Mn family superoxide dismutase
MQELLIQEQYSPRVKEVEILPLNFTDREVSPVLSKATLDLHYGKLAKGYAKRYNNREGDKDFNFAGVFLHNLLFTQYRAVRDTNNPNGPIKNFIEKNYKTYAEFKNEFEEEAMKIQGSGWIYLANDGKIKTIQNHEVRKDILLLIDWWEHAWILDYSSDKKKYLKEQWKIIDWNVISTRWGKSL